VGHPDWPGAGRAEPRGDQRRGKAALGSAAGGRRGAQGQRRRAARREAEARALSPPLAGFQKRWLCREAHALRAVVQVGEGGLTEAVARAIDRALLDHELVKVRLTRPEDKRALAAELAQATGAQVAGLVGHTVILYRPHPEAPRLRLPARGEAGRSSSGLSG
jgi:RNA-binding protein